MKYILTIVTCLTVTFGFAQRKASDYEQLLTVGFQLRPVVASRFLDAGEQTATDRIFTTIIKPKLGYTFGMVMRRGFTSKLSLETGINYIRRNYHITAIDDSLGKRDETDFGMVSYEIPVQGLVYVRLGERFYMNNALGVSINWFASDVATVGIDNRFNQRSFLNRIIFNPALLTNIGFEYRTEKAGFFYLGASLHRPFIPIAKTRAQYDLTSVKYENWVDLTGAFLTVDLRYFFHEAPIKKKTQSKKKKKDEKSTRSK